MKYQFEYGEIYYCEQCPVGIVPPDYPRRLCLVENEWIEDEFEIPEWCPLKEVKE